MLKNAKVNMDEHTNYKELVSQLRQELSGLQLKIRDKKLPVIVVFEGWSASGKGSLIAEMIKYLDPRFFKVHSFLPATPSEMRYPLLNRFWKDIPEYGKMLIMDRSWYQELAIARMEEDISSKEYNGRVKAVNTFERQLSDDGYLIIKLFLHISKEEQAQRFEKLCDNDDTSWRVTKLDKKRHKHYDEYFDAFDDMTEKTNTAYAPWNIIDATDKTFAKYQMFSIITESITKALEEKRQPNPINEVFPLLTMPALADISLDDKVLSPDEYAEQLKKCQKELSKLHNRLYRAKIPMIIAFEGWDAAGKGGNIKRLAYPLDPRGFDVYPIASPEAHELARHYLWRFWNKLPKKGHVAVFDRSWYGRVMVERIEGYCTENDWQRAYNEINEFERELTNWGAVVMKFWLHIDSDTQLQRFEARQNTPSKQWKITDEDWRNREKWAAYETSVNEMLQKTSTPDAPWHIIESNDKYYARIKTLRIVKEALEKALGK